MSNPNSIIAEKAERGAAHFAKERRLSMDDPIIKTLRNGLRMAFGRVARRNRIAAQDAALQPGLFDSPPKSPLKFERPAPETAPASADSTSRDANE